jgi:hypothetical protein
MDPASAQEMANFFDDLAQSNSSSSWCAPPRSTAAPRALLLDRGALTLRRRYTKLVPRAAYTSLNDAFFDYANASGLPLPRRPSAHAGAADSHQLQLATTAKKYSRSLGGANPRCRHFVSDELGMSTEDAKKQGARRPTRPVTHRPRAHRCSWRWQASPTGSR